MSKINVSIVQNWDDLLTTSVADNDPDIVYNFTQDPLLVSCTLYRLIKDAEKGYQYRNWSLTEHMDKIAAKINDQDRVFAEIVRSYYKSKLLVAKLRNEHFTKYRTDLLTYLTDSPSCVTSKFVGMIYKLPYFYEYDMKLTEIFGGEYSEVKGPSRVEGTIALSFIDKVHNGRKRSVVNEYWFQDPNGVRIVLPLLKTNPITNLWEHHIKNNVSYIEAIFQKKNKDTWAYYEATGWEINVPED